MTNNITFTAKTPDELLFKTLFVLTLIAQQEGEEAAHTFLDKAISIINEYPYGPQHHRRTRLHS